jgi:hypothetical protein
MFGGFSSFFPFRTVSTSTSSAFVASNFFSAVAPWQATHLALNNAAASSWVAVRADPAASRNAAPNAVQASKSDSFLNRLINTLIIASKLLSAQSADEIP